MTTTTRIVSLLVAAGVIAALGVFLLTRDDAGPAAAPEDAVAITFENQSFDQDVYELPITPPPRQDVSVVVINRDAGIPHGVAIYPEQQGEPLLDHPVFISEPVPGQSERVFTFAAPEEPGTYALRCSVHEQVTATVRFVQR